MPEKFIRDQNNKIIDKKTLIEQGHYVVKKIELEKQLARINNEIDFIINMLDGKLSKKERNRLLNKLIGLKLDMQEVNELIEKLDNSIIYNHFNQTDFKVEKKDMLEFIPILSEKQREKNKHLQLAFYYSRKKNRESVFITLDPDDYK